MTEAELNEIENGPIGYFEPIAAIKRLAAEIRRLQQDCLALEAVRFAARLEVDKLRRLLDRGLPIEAVA